MAKVVKKKKSGTQKKTLESPFNIYWKRKNYILLFIGIAFLIIGFYVMTIGNWDSFPSLVISPILLFIGYVFVIPASIFYKEKQEPEQTQGKEIASGKS
jgi:membrane protein YdbS with pleckstrin-like domain